MRTRVTLTIASGHSEEVMTLAEATCARAGGGGLTPHQSEFNREGEKGDHRAVAMSRDQATPEEGLGALLATASLQDREQAARTMHTALLRRWVS